VTLRVCIAISPRDHGRSQIRIMVGKSLIAPLKASRYAPPLKKEKKYKHILPKNLSSIIQSKKPEPISD